VRAAWPAACDHAEECGTTSDVENLILVQLREMRGEISTMRTDISDVKKRLDSIEGRFDELRGYVSYALGRGQMNCMKGSELDAVAKAHAARFAEIERRLAVIEERTN
jgi:hypothetical protein